MPQSHDANRPRRTVAVRRVDQCRTLDELFRHCLPAFGGAFLRRIYTILDRAMTLSIAGPVNVSLQHEGFGPFPNLTKCARDELCNKGPTKVSRWFV